MKKNTYHIFIYIWIRLNVCVSFFCIVTNVYLMHNKYLNEKHKICSTYIIKCKYGISKIINFNRYFNYIVTRPFVVLVRLRTLCKYNRFGRHLTTTIIIITIIVYLVLVIHTRLVRKI